MKPDILRKALLFALLLVTHGSICSAAEQPVGRFVQLRGTTTVERNKATHQAKIKGDILMSDVIVTASGSRAKLLFIDDSVLTMGESSKMAVREFIHSKGKEGKSVFNLLDGKMRSVVGKTRFEVHTPTAVAAARGTVIYFDVGMVNEQSYSKIICLEGNVEIRNVVSTVAGQVTLTPGTMVIVKANEPPPPPVTAPQSELDRARSSTNGQDNQSGGGEPGPDKLDKPVADPKNETIIINQQPIVQPRKVNITIGIPGQ